MINLPSTLVDESVFAKDSEHKKQIESRLGRQGNERNCDTRNCDIKNFQAFDIKPEEIKALPAINLRLRLTSRVPDDKYFRKKE